MQRRDFLRYSALGAAAVTLAPVPGMGTTVKKTSKNDAVRMGFIGLGQQAMYLLSGFMSMPDVRVVAGCDVYDIKRDRFVRRVKEYYGGKGEKKVKVDVYEDYQDLLARTDIDAVVIATPDHQHAIIAIAACKAGKDVYLEKPATLTIYDGQLLWDLDRPGGGSREVWLELGAGYHRLEVQYFENYGGECMDIGMKGSGIDVTNLPAAMLFHE